jgi:cobalt-zinc-cadmium efflux system outer membrane protein
MTAIRRRALPLLPALLAVLGCCWTLAGPAVAQPAEDARQQAAIRTPAQEPAPGAEGLLAPEPEGLLSLEDALTLAMMYNPLMSEFAWAIRASEGRVAQAKKWVNPELDVRLWRLSDLDGRVDVDRSRVILSQEFELGGERGRRVDLAWIECDLLEWDYEAKRLEVVTTVTCAFTDVLGAQRRVESLGRFVDFAERLEGTMQTLVEREVARELELHQLARQLGLARIDLQRAQADLAVSRYALVAAWGSSHPKFTEAAGDLERLGPLPGIELILELAANSPAMARREAEVARAQAAIAVAKARRVPDLKVGVGARRTEGTLAGTDYILDLEIPLPIADRRQGEIREAHARASGANAGREATRAATSRGVAEYYYRVLESEAASRTLRDEVLPASRKSFEAHRVGFANQVSSLDDLLDAGRNVARAENDLTAELVSYHQALAALEEIVGEKLTD